jgi:hypothetical protein
MNNSPHGNITRDTAVVAGLFFLTQVEPAYAYVDPGSISVVITAILGSIAAVGYSARMYFSRIKDFFKKSKSDRKRK